MKTGKDLAMAALSKLFLVFPQANGNDDERTARFAAYWEILESRESRFVIEACEYASKGKLGDGRFLPTVAELYQTTEEFAVRAARDRRESTPLLPRLPEPESQNDEATRQRIIAGFKKLLADLRSGNPIDP